MDQSELYAFMAGNRYGVVSSTAGDGAPQSALVGIAVTPELEIVFDTLKSMRKYRNLIERPACSFVVGWTGEQTLQFEGTAFEPEGAELARYQQAYFEVWPDGPARLCWQGLVHMAVRPTWVRYSDFDQRPAFIYETRFAGNYPTGRPMNSTPSNPTLPLDRPRSACHEIFRSR